MTDLAVKKRAKLYREELSILSNKRITPWVFDACIDWCVIITTFALVYLYPSVITVILAVLILGNRQHALTVLGHEAAHYALSKNKKLNDRLSDFFAFWPLGITTSGYRNVHMQHHKNTNTEHDPELAHRKSRSPQWDLPITWKKIAKYCCEDLIGFSLPDYIIIVRFSKPNSRKEYIPLILFHFLFIATAMALGGWWVAILWYASLVSSFMMFFRLRTFLEHLGTDDTHRLHLNWWQRHLIAPHNIWYHWEHHNFPAIPYYNLPHLRKIFTEVEILRLKDLLEFYKQAPDIKSGQVLRPEH